MPPVTSKSAVAAPPGAQPGASGSTHAGAQHGTQSAPERPHARWRRFVAAPVRVLLWLVAPPLAVILAALAVHAYRTDPRDAKTLVGRELTVGTLEEGEPIRAEASVIRRRPLDYFRATRGLLVLTDRRLLYVGLVPRDFASPESEPDVFEQREYPIDTTVKIGTTRAMFGTHRAVVLEANGQRDVIPVVEGGWSRAQTILGAIQARQNAQRAAAEADRQARLAAARAALA
jgi:hypothetical protein